MFGQYWMVVILLGVTSVAGAVDVDKSLLVYYTFEEGDVQDKPHGNVIDHGPSNHGGTLYGAKYVKTEKGYGISFPKGRGFVKCVGQGRVAVGSRDFTIELLLKLDSFSSGMILGKKAPELTSLGWQLAYDDKSRQISFNTSNGKQRDSVFATLDDLHWHHVTVRRKGNTISLYIDGHIAGTKTADLFGEDFDNTKVYLFLGRAPGKHNGYRGKMDEVLIRKGALPTRQIAARYAMQKKRMPAKSAEDTIKAARLNFDDPLVLHYRFDTPGDTAKDLSIYGNDGKIVNGQHYEELDGRRGVIRLSGKDSWINCGKAESLQADGDMSFEMWVRFNGPVGQWAPIFGDHPLHNFLLQKSGRQSLVLYIRNESSDYNVEAMAIPVDRKLITEKWSHVAVVVESPRCRFYLNGKLIHDAYVPFPVIDKAKITTKYIGGRKGASAPIDVDEFRLYQRALTPGEIKAHAQDQESAPVEDLELAIEPHWYNETLILRLSCKGIDLADHTASITLQDESQTIVARSGEITLVETGINRGRYVAEVKFPLLTYAGKLLEGIAQIEGPDGKVVKTVRKQKSLKKPDWVHSRAGHSDGVLQPWTAIKASQAPDGDVNVEVWGRTHVFGKESLLKHVSALGADLLAAPVTMESKVDGKVVSWKDDGIKLIDSTDTTASFKQTREGDAITMRINTTVEYDGFITYECEIQARRDLSMDALTLDIPLKTQYVKYCYGDRVYPEKLNPRIPISQWHSGAIHGDLSFRFSGNIWLGDNERGLCWQTESDEYWHYGEKQKAIEILPRGDTTTFRAHLVDIPTQLSKGETLRYKFALQATPIKPMVRDAWDLRIVRSEPYGKDLDLPTQKMPDGRPVLQAYADYGIEYLFINVNDIFPWPMPVHEEFTTALHRMFKEVHAYGLKAHDYQIHQRIPVDIPEFDIHGGHMAQQPMRWYVQNGNPKGHQRPGPLTADYGANSQSTVMHCPKSMAAQDAYIHSLALRMATFGDDGVYLDGSNASPPCQNLMHGCGYRAKDGSIHSTYPVFAARQFMKRIYTVVKKNKPDGLVDLHCSFCFNPTSVAYSDVYWTGEQWWHLRGKGAEHIPDELSLDQFRTEFMGYQFGIPANTLAYRLGSKMDVAAISLLHDVPVRPNSREHDALTHKASADYSAVLFKIWKLRDQFDAKNARKRFYWNNHDYVAVSPDHGHAFLLHHPKNGVLAYLCNLDREKQTVSASFNLDKLGLAGREVEVVNALTQEKIDMTADGTLSIPLNSMQWGYYWIKPTNAGK